MPLRLGVILQVSSAERTGYWVIIRLGVNVTVANKAGCLYVCFPCCEVSLQDRPQKFLGSSFTWVASEDIKPCRPQSSLGTWRGWPYNPRFLRCL